MSRSGWPALNKTQAPPWMGGLVWIGRVGFEPTRGITPADFRTTMAFATLFAVCGLDFPSTLGAYRRSRPSSLYTLFLLPL